MEGTVHSCNNGELIPMWFGQSSVDALLYPPFVTMIVMKKIKTKTVFVQSISKTRTAIMTHVAKKEKKRKKEVTIHYLIPFYFL